MYRTLKTKSHEYIRKSYGQSIDANSITLRSIFNWENVSIICVWYLTWKVGGVVPSVFFIHPLETYRRVGVYSLNTLVSTRCSFNTTNIRILFQSTKLLCNYFQNKNANYSMLWEQNRLLIFVV